MTNKDPIVIADPEFRCKAEESYALDACLEVSSPDSGYKSSRYTKLNFCTEGMGGYPMRIALRIDNNPDWFEQLDVNEISISFAGDYEASELKRFFQHVGAMLTVTYGTPLTSQNED